MGIASKFLQFLLIVACVGSAVGDIRKPQSLLDSMAILKIPVEKLSILGVIKIIAAAGLIVGFSSVRLAEFTGLCLAFYFAVATGSHVRVKDTMKNTAPAFALLVASVLFTLTTIAK